MKDAISKGNLFKALGLFIEGIRDYIFNRLSDEYGKDKWPEYYYNTINHSQKEQWDDAIKSGTEPKSLIDFHNLKGFALGSKDIIIEDFGKQKANSLPTWFQDIADVRHKCHHFQELDEIEVERAYSNMIIILNVLEMNDIANDIKNLKANKYQEERKKERSKKVKVIKVKKGKTNKDKSENIDYSDEILPWFTNVTPHNDIRQGYLDESVFAANLSEVALGNGREVYLNPAIFFEKTYFTEGLTNIAKRIVKGLNGGEDSENRVISLQTGFGGGKTHTLITLYHIAKIGDNLPKQSFTKELVKYTGAVKHKKVNVAVFTNNTNDPAQGRKIDNLHIKTLWGELAYQLGGSKAYNLIKENDNKSVSPKGLFKQVLEMSKPALILIDELADYCVAASGIEVGNSSLSDQTISFIQELTEAISSVDKCVLVATLPMSNEEVGNTPQAINILNSLTRRITRVGSDTNPVADDEIYEVIRRRLFEDLDEQDEQGEQNEINKVIDTYYKLYTKIKSELPDSASKIQYKDLLLKSYPFHPELIKIFKDRWASHHAFQRTRGILRILASIVSDLWKRKDNLTTNNYLIHTSDISFENLDALIGQLKKLYGNGYDAVISSDVSGKSSNSYKIDEEKPEYKRYNITQGISSTILLGSFGGSNRGLDIEEIKLCLIQPNSFNHNSINGSLDNLESNAHYLYYTTLTTKSKRYWFYTKPNINILINQASSEISSDEINNKIIDLLNEQTKKITRFNILINPHNDLPEQKILTLVFLGPEYSTNMNEINEQVKKKVEIISTKKGNTERIYRNTLLFIICSEIGYSKLADNLRNYLACIKIKNDYKNQLEPDQIKDIETKLNEYNKSSLSSLIDAYIMVMKHSVKDGLNKIQVKSFKKDFKNQIDSIYTYLKDEEWIVESLGLGLLRKNNLLPSRDNPVKVKDIYESFIRFDDKPLISNELAVKDSVLKYCINGEYAIAYGDKTDLKKIYFKESVKFFNVTDDMYWLVDKSLYDEYIRSKTKPEENKEVQTHDGKINNKSENPIEDEKDKDEETLKSITVSGKVDLSNYTQILNSFILPLQKNDVEIEIKIKGKSTNDNPLTKKSQQYKITKESADQLNLNFEIEE